MVDFATLGGVDIAGKWVGVLSTDFALDFADRLLDASARLKKKRQLAL